MPDDRVSRGARPAPRSPARIRFRGRVRVGARNSRHSKPLVRFDLPVGTRRCPRRAPRGDHPERKADDAAMFRMARRPGVPLVTLSGRVACIPEKPLIPEIVRGGSLGKRLQNIGAHAGVSRSDQAGTGTETNTGGGGPLPFSPAPTPQPTARSRSPCSSASGSARTSSPSGRGRRRRSGTDRRRGPRHGRGTGPFGTRPDRS
jgi:hypothetical protein